MSPSEREYYRSRAKDERSMAAKAASPAAAELHEELACMYERLVELEERTPGLTLVWPTRLSA